MDADRRPVAVLSVIRTVAETGSTNADLLALARAGVEEGVWLRAERQTAGRGRQGRAWTSPPGNFYGSTAVRLRPRDPPAPTLGFVAAVALEEVVSGLLAAGVLATKPDGSPQKPSDPEPSPGFRPGGVILKWPNDLLIDGAKLSGILLERADDAVVVGIGVNLAHHPDLLDRRATSLAAHGVMIAPQPFAELLAVAFARWLATWRIQGFAAVRVRWLARAHPPGAPLRAALPDGSAVEGAFEDMDRTGALILRLADGARRSIHAGDVFLV